MRSSFNVLSVNTAALVGAVGDAEASQRRFLLTGGIAQRDLFLSDAERVDQRLVSPSSLSADGAPGFGAAPARQALIEDRLSTLAEEAASRSVAASDAGATPLMASAGRETATSSRNWTGMLVEEPQQRVMAGLSAIHSYVELVLSSSPVASYSDI